MRFILAALAVTTLSGEALAAVDTQSVFTSTSGDTLRLSRTDNPDASPNYYTADVFIDQATGLFAPFATLPFGSQSDFIGSRLGANPQLQVRTIQPSGSFFTLNFFFNGNNLFAYDYTSVFCEAQAAAAQQAVTCFNPNDITSVRVDYYNSIQDDPIFSQEVFGAVVSSPFIEAPAAVPEPAAWAMMIAGFGAVGAAMRRRRVAVGLKA